MKELIENIIREFGPREAGSVDERSAQLYIKDLFGEFCDNVRVQEFTVALKAKFQSLKIFCSLLYLSLFLFWFSPLAAFIISLVNSILFFGHFVTYRNWLDFLFQMGKSLNVIGDIEPLNEAKNTIIFSGHMDSAREFIWWYRLKQLGLIMTIGSGFVIVLFAIVPLLALIFPNSSWVNILWWVFLMLSPITITMFSIHGKNAVPGAQDNLSGVTVATALGRYFSENRLQHTRIRVLSYGCEEIGLRGSDAYARQFNDSLKSEHAICVNMDGIMDPDNLNIIVKEPSLFVKYPDEMINKLESAFNAEGVNYFKHPLPFGATDGASTQRHGIPSITIVGFTFAKLDPTYHTRLDVPEYVDEKALELVKQVLIRFALNEDES